MKSSKQFQENVLNNNVIEKELEHLSFAISHDLRNVVNHIANFFKLLESNLNKNLGEKEQRYVKIINERLVYLDKMLEEILLYNHIIRSQINLSEIDLNELIQNVIDELTTKNYKEIKNKINWKIGNFPKILGDPKLIKELFIILITNAIKFSKNQKEINIEMNLIDPKTKNLSLINLNKDNAKDNDEYINPSKLSSKLNKTNKSSKLDRTSKTNKKIILAIKDNGIGFNLKNNERLFNLFQKLHNDENIEGVGSGLAKALRIINMHNEQIWAEGAENEGATFYFTLIKA